MKNALHEKINGWSIVRSSLLFYGLPGILLVACVLKAKDLDVKKPAKTEQVAPAGVPVDAQIIHPGVIRDELQITANLVANQQVGIVSELTRRVVHVAVKDGASVSKGDLLFRLDDADLQAQAERLREQRHLAELNEGRLKDLIAHDAIAQQDYDEASTNLKVIDAQIRETAVLIGKTSITAPFAGQLGMIMVHTGAIVSVNTLLTSIEDNSIIKVEFAVPEKYVNLIRIGSKQEFTIVSSQKKYETTVAAREGSLDQNTRTLRVRGTTPNTDGQLLPGQSARLKLSLNTADDALTIHSQALIPSPKGYAVFVSRKGTATPVPVEIGQRSSGEVEITKGLSAGDTVITSNLLRLSPGAPVSLVTIK